MNRLRSLVVLVAISMSLVLLLGMVRPPPDPDGARGAAAAPGRSGTFYDSIDPGLIGGMLGAAVGVWGGLLGTVGGICAPRGAAKGLVISLFALQIAGGLVLIGLGIGAFVSDAPWMVGYSFLLPGGLAALLGIMLLPVVLARYRQAELRRIEAEAFRAG